MHVPSQGLKGRYPMAPSILVSSVRPFHSFTSRHSLNQQSTDSNILFVLPPQFPLHSILLVLPTTLSIRYLHHILCKWLNKNCKNKKNINWGISKGINPKHEHRIFELLQLLVSQAAWDTWLHCSNLFYKVQGQPRMPVLKISTKSL